MLPKNMGYIPNYLLINFKLVALWEDNLVIDPSFLEKNQSHDFVLF